MNDIDNLRDTIVPKSDQLNADDLTGTQKIITVTAVKRGSTKEQPISVEYIGMEGRPYKPCKTMRRVLIAAWGEDGREWTGRSMRLYSDPDVKFGGVKVGGIRINALSHIEKEMKILLTLARGNRGESKVSPLPAYPQETFEQNKSAWVAAIKAGKLDIETIISKASNIGILTETQISQIKQELIND